MTHISVECPECGHSITIEISTIDLLRKTVNTLEKENKEMRTKIFELENQCKVNNLFGGMFK